MNTISLDEELNSAFVAPNKDYMGEPLANYTEGSRLLLMQVRDDADSSIYFIWSFIFIHLQLFKNRKEATKLAWNRDLFREKLLEYIDGKTEADRDMATSIVSSMIEEASKGRVEIIPTPNSPDSGNA
jgi:hypothetical protein